MLHCKSCVVYVYLAPWGVDSMFRSQRIDYTGPRMWSFHWRQWCPKAGNEVGQCSPIHGILASEENEYPGVSFLIKLTNFMPQLEIQNLAVARNEQSNPRFHALRIAKAKANRNKFPLGLTAIIKCRCAWYIWPTRGSWILRKYIWGSNLGLSPLNHYVKHSHICTVDILTTLN